MRIAIVGAGISGLVAAYEFDQHKTPYTLFEATDRVGGTLSTVVQDGFIMEGGPDGWVSEKPWLGALAEELGLATIPSNDAQRVTYIYRDGVMHAVPDGMRMMVPTDLDSLHASSLFSGEAIQAYTQEIERAAWLRDHPVSEEESVANFVRRHFGEEVTRTIAAPLLAGVFGGDVEQLSAQSVMPNFVAMERQYGSLILALREKTAKQSGTIFTALRDGMGSVVDALRERLSGEIRINSVVTTLTRHNDGFLVDGEFFDHVVLATPAHITRRLMSEVDGEAAQLLEMDASSAVLVFLGFKERLEIPKGFGFLVPPDSSGCDLLAGTFVDQKFDGRVPEGGSALRAFFGSLAAERLQDESDAYLVGLARAQMAQILKIEIPEPVVTLVRRWPRSLPQYAVGHADRMRRLGERMCLYPSLTLLGNAYRGVGLPDLVRDARAAAQRIAHQG